jgi:broad specificity phosphatase PhoE
MKWLVLIRHGESTGDVEDRYGGSYDDDLTARGREQAAVLGAALRDVGMETLLASPYKRARQTAAIVGRALQLDVQVADDWRECNRYGIVSGMVKSEALRTHPSQVKLLADLHKTVQGAEPYADFRKRVAQACAAAYARPEKCIGIVTHGGTIKAVIREMLGRGEAEIGDCAYMILAGDSAQTMRVIRAEGITFMLVSERK